MRRSRREQLAGLLEKTGVLSALVRWRERAPARWLSILTYHRFAGPPGAEPFDDGVVDVTPEEFERQVVTLKKHFNVVGSDELCDFARGVPLPRNPVAITFDDGYAGVHEHALPILKRHDCKAIVFVATSFISKRSVYWWDRVAYIVKNSTRDEVWLKYPFPMQIDLACRVTAIERVLRLIKAHPRLDLGRLLDELGDAAGVPFTPEMDRAFADQLLMNWDQVRELKAAGIDVESHTRTHRVLETLSPRDLAEELRGSSEDLVRELGSAPRALAYPVGKPVARESEIRGELARAGYTIAFTNGTGPTPLDGHVDPFGISRHMVDRGASDAYCLAVLTLPSLAAKHAWRLDHRAT
ncbi:MAG TPA: polysaccharide deacetylase family protein [Polyangiaceae bacterium]|jgi:peptidoglycan/xylan/chitin deacetylase (PgdA/CDA1 family)|nr:polysaccharide deacetylase family protein [Polyangiaceae bacterium]